MVASKPQSVGRSNADLFNKSAHNSYSYFNQSAVTNIFVNQKLWKRDFTVDNITRTPAV